MMIPSVERLCLVCALKAGRRLDARGELVDVGHSRVQPGGNGWSPDHRLKRPPAKKTVEP